MFGVLVICALALTETASRVEALPQYVQNVKYLRQVEELVDRRVVDRVYNVLQPDLHYLVAVGVVVRTAKALTGCLVPPVDKVYVENLDLVVPDVLLYPVKLVNEVQYVRRVVVDRLKPLVDTVLNVCNGVEDNDKCNQLVDQEVQKRPELKPLVKVLLSVGKVAKVAVEKDNVLYKVSESLDVLPYLVKYQKDVVQSVKVLAEVLRAVKVVPIVDC